VLPAAAERPKPSGASFHDLTLVGETGDHRPVETFEEAFFTDVAFQGRYAYQGTWNGGFRIVDISRPWRPEKRPRAPYVSSTMPGPEYNNDPVWRHECSAEHDKFQIVSVPLDDPEDAEVIADVPLQGGHSCHDIGVLLTRWTSAASPRGSSRLRGASHRSAPAGSARMPSGARSCAASCWPRRSSRSPA